MFEETLNPPKRRLDWQLLVALAGLMLVGTAFIFSAKPEADSLPWHQTLAARQLLWYTLGLAAATAATLVDYRILARWALVAYWTGKGWRQGQQIALGYLPPGASHNDFIFSVIAEEKGFPGQHGGSLPLCGGAPLRSPHRQPGARSPGPAAGHGSGRPALQSRVRQYRHEHSLDACDGYTTAAAQLRRIVSALLVDRRRHPAKHHLHHRDLNLSL
jgi:hypothetical protein